jgi:2,4-dienoyl-CoA reductase-like NADH-dependent reductase (Old Yellow Enzyme family)/thioredoxin reductase
MERFQHLFSPIQIGSVTVRNRIAISAHATFLGDLKTQLPNEREVAYYEARAKGGAGLIIFRLTSVYPEANPFRHPDAITWFKKTAEAIHRHGAKMFVQLGHQGAQSGLNDPPPAPAGPSYAPVLYAKGRPLMSHKMTIAEIEQTIAEFAFAARLCREAGADGIELHGAHGYLIDEFMSQAFNRRDDKYGGSFENRLRFPLEVIDAVREVVREDYVVGMRLDGDEFIEGGIDLEKSKLNARRLVEGKKLDYLNISCGTYASIEVVVDPMYFPLNSFVYLAAGIKEVVDIPVIARGRIIDPVQAEQILANHQADMVSMVRASIADPEFPNKARQGRLDEIRKCLGCNELCWNTITDLRQLFTFGMSCTMNPVVGRETLPGWLELKPADKAKRVMIVGGGPAGLETARVTAERGHLVSLYEKGPELGGRVLIAAKAPGRDGFLDCVRYYEYELKRLKVDIHLETQVTADMVMKNNPDAVVVATGTVPYAPEIPGIDQENVYDVLDVLSGMKAVGSKVVIVDGEWRMKALSLADHLASQGKQVEVLCEDYYFGALVENSTRKVIIRRLLQAGVTLSPLTRLKKVSGNSVVVENILTEQERTIENVDSVVLAYSGKENTALYVALKGYVKELYAVGECFFGGRRLPDAILAGATVGRQL